MCTYGHVYVRAHTWVCISVVQMSVSSVTPQDMSIWVFEASWDLGLSAEARLAGQRALGSACLLLPGTGMESIQSHGQILSYVFGGRDSDPHACSAKI